MAPESTNDYDVSAIAFDAEGATLRGWLFRPTSTQTPAPVVVMAHGYNCLKEFYLDKYAAAGRRRRTLRRYLRP